MQCNAVLSVVVIVINIEAVLNRPSQCPCLNAAEVRGDRGHEYSFPGTGLVSPPHRPSCVDYVLNECSNKYNPAEVTSGDLERRSPPRVVCWAARLDARKREENCLIEVSQIS